MTDSGMIAIIISVAAATFAYLAARRAREANRIALYDRRLALFRVVQAELSEVLRNGDATIASANKLLEPLQEARFLFPKEVPTYIENLRAHMLSLRFAEVANRRRSPTEDALDRRDRAFKLLLQDIDNLFAVFVPAMSVVEWTARDNVEELKKFGARTAEAITSRAKANQATEE